MNLSSPLRSLVPSLDSSVLEVLAGSESAFGTTQVARLAGRGSRQGIQLVLDRLAEHGLVLAEPINRGHMYRLNRAHLLVPAVLSALSVRRELLTRLRFQVDALTPTPAYAAAFGSFARAEGGPDSDIDLLLVMDSGFVTLPEWERQVRRLEDDVHAWTGNRLETLTLDVDGLARAVLSSEPLIDELRRDAVTLAGAGIDRVIASAGGRGDEPAGADSLWSA